MLDDDSVKGVNVMKIIMYGSEICPDCVHAIDILKKRTGIEIDYRNITESVKTMKEFLHYRDHDNVFEDIIREGKIGIPFFILEDGSKTFDIYSYLGIESPESGQVENSCSIDGEGSC